MFKNSAFCPIIGTKRLLRRGKQPMAVSCLILRLNRHVLENSDSTDRTELSIKIKIRQFI